MVVRVAVPKRATQVGVLAYRLWAGVFRGCYRRRGAQVVYVSGAR